MFMNDKKSCLIAIIACINSTTKNNTAKVEKMFANFILQPYHRYLFAHDFFFLFFCFFYIYNNARFGPWSAFHDLRGGPERVLQSHVLTAREFAF